MGDRQDRQMAQAQHPSLLAQPQDLHQQITQRLKVAAPDFTDRSVIGLPVAGQHLKGQILVAGPLDPAGGDDGDAVAVEQQQRQPLCGRLLPDPSKNTPGGHSRASHSVMEVAGSSAPAARDRRTWTFACSVLSPELIAVTGICADLGTSVESSDAD